MSEFDKALASFKDELKDASAKDLEDAVLTLEAELDAQYLGVIQLTDAIAYAKAKLVLLDKAKPHKVNFHHEVEATPMTQDKFREHIGWGLYEKPDSSPVGYLIVDDNVESWVSESEYAKLTTPTCCKDA